MSWTAEVGGRDVNAPVFFLPLQMKKGRDFSAVDVQVAGDPAIKPVLLHVLADEFNVFLSKAELLSAVMPKEPEDSFVLDAGQAVSAIDCY